MINKLKREGKDGKGSKIKRKQAAEKMKTLFFNGVMTRHSTWCAIKLKPVLKNIVRHNIFSFIVVVS